MLGGITLAPRELGIRRIPPRPVPAPRPIVPREPRDDPTRLPAHRPAGLADIDDIPPESGDKLKDVADDPIPAVGRGRKEIGEPPPMRLGMNPSNLPV
jgi:hypothetical protein